MDIPLIARTLRAAGCVYADEEAALLVESAGADHDALRRLVRARVSGQPLEHVLGWADFAGLRVAVGPGAFVPRLRTVLLAETARRLVGDGAVVVELCCGVGAAAALVQLTSPPIRLYAVDIDPVAIRYARRNLAAPAATLVGDLYEPLPAGLRGRVDVIMANAPYVPTGAIIAMPREARDHEPRVALDGGPDGTTVQRRIIGEAPEWLRPGGSVIIESGRQQAALTARLMADRALAVEVVTDDERDATVVVGRR